MRLGIGLVLAILAVVPLAVAGPPATWFIGIDPDAVQVFESVPYDEKTATNCIIPLELQVQTDGGGGWDVIMRFTEAGSRAMPPERSLDATFNGIPSCTNAVHVTYTFFSVEGSPATGLSYHNETSSGCQSSDLTIPRFSWSGSARLKLVQTYDAAACGASGAGFIGVLNARFDVMG